MQSNADSDRVDGQEPPGDELYLAVRASFVTQGSSFARWCRENGVCRPYAEQAIKGQLSFNKARELKARVLEAAGITA